jgi:hypothetical protein
VTVDEVRTVELNVFELQVSGDVMVEQGQLDA